jgi:hypothetical protein
MRWSSPWRSHEARRAATIVVTVLVASALAGSSDASADAATGSLDRGTASVLADDIGFDSFCDADCDVSLHRCYRVDSLRVDCIMSLDTGDDDWSYFVIATALVDGVLQFGDYPISGHPRVTRSLIGRPGCDPPSATSVACSRRCIAPGAGPEPEPSASAASAVIVGGACDVARAGCRPVRLLSGVP